MYGYLVFTFVNTLCILLLEGVRNTAASKHCTLCLHICNYKNPYKIKIPGPYSLNSEIKT